MGKRPASKRDARRAKRPKKPPVRFEKILVAPILRSRRTGERTGERGGRMGRKNKDRSKRERGERNRDVNFGRDRLSVTEGTKRIPK